MSKTKLATEFSKAEDSPGLLLWQLSNKWQAKQRAALKTFGLTHVQFVLLATLTYAEGTVRFTQKQLAEYAQIDEMMTSQVLRKLEQKELVKRRVSKIDKRAFTISATPHGIKLANQAVRIVEEVDRQFFGVLEREKISAFTETMRRLVE